MIIYLLGPCGSGKSYLSTKLRKQGAMVIDADQWLFKHHKRLAYSPFMWDALFYVGSLYFKELEKKYANRLVYVDVGGGFIVSRQVGEFFKGRPCVYVKNRLKRALYVQARKRKPFLKDTPYLQYIKEEFSRTRQKLYASCLFTIDAQKTDMGKFNTFLDQYLNWKQ